MLPVHTLKIDRSFACVPADKVSLAPVSTIIALARTHRLVTVTEGVETTAHFETLRELGMRAVPGLRAWQTAAVRRNPPSPRRSAIGGAPVRERWVRTPNTLRGSLLSVCSIG